MISGIYLKEAIVIFVLNATGTTSSARFCRKVLSAYINEARVLLTVRNQY